MIKVSIICNVYNHGKYIEDCLKGFIMQKTDFPYEVLIHDDASTDESASIIRRYEEKYPNIIKPIYQVENQYSRGIYASNTYQFPRAQGKYIAFCEGDDYWIDSYKLQKQIDYMESHPDCTFCFTNGYIEDQNNNKRRVFIPYNSIDEETYIDISREYTIDNISELSFVPTASFLFPNESREKVKDWFVAKCPTADLQLRLFLTAEGYAYYLNDKTCVYRQNVPASAMTKWKEYSRKKNYEHTERVLRMIDSLDQMTMGQYKESIKKIKYPYICNLLFSATSLEVLRNKEYREIYNTFSIQRKIKFVLKILMPEAVIRFIRKSRERNKE